MGPKRREQRIGGTGDGEGNGSCPLMTVDAQEAQKHWGGSLGEGRLQWST